MKHRFLTYLLMLLVSMNAMSQVTLSGIVRNNNNEALTAAVVQLQQDTTLVAMTMTNRKGEFNISDITNGEYTITVTCYGYQSQLEKLNITATIRKDFTLEQEAQVMLEEVTAIADMSQVVLPNATGTVYRLSNRAKGLKNPYESLQEIPRLIVVPTEKKVMLEDGSSPLILINGKRFGGSIDSVDPSLVDEVELIESPSARYLKEGIRSVLNIRMKRRKASYYNGNITTRHMLPLLYGITMPYFESGNNKISFNVSAQHFYFHHDDADWVQRQNNSGYHKESSGDQRYNMQSYYADMNIDWLASENDNLVFNASIIYSPAKTVKKGTGSLASKGNFTMRDVDKGDYFVNSYNLYYRHVFSKKTMLEATGHFNLNGNNTKGQRAELYDDWNYDFLYDFDNFRYSGGLDLDFATKVGTQSLELGSHLSFTKDRVEQTTENNPIFHHRNWNEYLYGNLSGNISKKLSYALSIGFDVMSRKVVDKYFDYVRPVEMASLNYRINQSSSIDVRYNLENVSPVVAQLNPYNTSTDSLEIISGNPYLLPSRHYNWVIQYRYNKNGWSFQPSVSYHLYTDNIDRVGITDPLTSIYTNTYLNYNKYRRLVASVNIGYRSNKWGGISFTVNNNTNFYEGQSGKNYFSLTSNFYGWIKKWSWNGYINYFPKRYTINSRTKSRGAESEVTITYKVSNVLSLNAGMRYFLGRLESKTLMQDGTYESFNQLINKDRAFRVLIGLSIYVSRNNNVPYRQKKQLNSTEKGITIK